MSPPIRTPVQTTPAYELPPVTGDIPVRRGPKKPAETAIVPQAPLETKTDHTPPALERRSPAQESAAEIRRLAKGWTSAGGEQAIIDAAKKFIEVDGPAAGVKNPAKALVEALGPDYARVVDELQSRGRQDAFLDLTIDAASTRQKEEVLVAVHERSFWETLLAFFGLLDQQGVFPRVILSAQKDGAELRRLVESSLNKGVDFERMLDAVRPQDRKAFLNACYDLLSLDQRASAIVMLARDVGEGDKKAIIDEFSARARASGEELQLAALVRDRQAAMEKGAKAGDPSAVVVLGSGYQSDARLAEIDALKVPARPSQLAPLGLQMAGAAGLRYLGTLNDVERWLHGHAEIEAAIGLIATRPAGDPERVKAEATLQGWRDRLKDAKAALAGGGEAALRGIDQGLAAQKAALAQIEEARGMHKDDPVWQRDMERLFVYVDGERARLEALRADVVRRSGALDGGAAGAVAHVSDGLALHEQLEPPLAAYSGWAKARDAAGAELGPDHLLELPKELRDPKPALALLSDLAPRRAALKQRIQELEHLRAPNAGELAALQLAKADFARLEAAGIDLERFVRTLAIVDVKVSEDQSNAQARSAAQLLQASPALNQNMSDRHMGELVAQYDKELAGVKAERARLEGLVKENKPRFDALLAKQPRTAGEELELITLELLLNGSVTKGADGKPQRKSIQARLEELPLLERGLVEAKAHAQNRRHELIAAIDEIGGIVGVGPVEDKSAAGIYATIEKIYAADTGLQTQGFWIEKLHGQNEGKLRLYLKADPDSKDPPLSFEISKNSDYPEVLRFVSALERNVDERKYAAYEHLRAHIEHVYGTKLDPIAADAHDLDKRYAEAQSKLGELTGRPGIDRDTKRAFLFAPDAIGQMATDPVNGKRAIDKMRAELNDQQEIAGGELVGLQFWLEAKYPRGIDLAGIDEALKDTRPEQQGGLPADVRQMLVLARREPELSAALSDGRTPVRISAATVEKLLKRQQILKAVSGPMTLAEFSPTTRDALKQQGIEVHPFYVRADKDVDRLLQALKSGDHVKVLEVIEPLDAHKRYQVVRELEAFLHDWDNSPDKNVGRPKDLPARAIDRLFLKFSPAERGIVAALLWKPMEAFNQDLPQVQGDINNSERPIGKPLVWMEGLEEFALKAAIDVIPVVNVLNEKPIAGSFMYLMFGGQGMQGLSLSPALRKGLGAAIHDANVVIQAARGSAPEARRRAGSEEARRAAEGAGQDRRAARKRRPASALLQAAPRSELQRRDRRAQRASEEDGEQLARHRRSAARRLDQRAADGRRVQLAARGARSLAAHQRVARDRRRHSRRHGDGHLGRRCASAREGLVQYRAARQGRQGLVHRVFAGERRHGAPDGRCRPARRRRALVEDGGDRRRLHRRGVGAHDRGRSRHLVLHRRREGV